MARMRKFIQPVADSARMQASTMGKPVSPFCPGRQKRGVVPVVARIIIVGVQGPELELRLGFQLLHEMAMPMQPRGEGIDGLDRDWAITRLPVQKPVAQMVGGLRHLPHRDRAPCDMG
jgi:hypothetical protein